MRNLLSLSEICTVVGFGEPVVTPDGVSAASASCTLNCSLFSNMASFSIGIEMSNVCVLAGITILRLVDPV